MTLKRALSLAVSISCCVLIGCFEYTEDPNGSLRSVGVPGAATPVWQSSKPVAALTPAEMGLTPEEAAKVSGPILVEPPEPPANVYRYHYYYSGQNKCQEDLQKMLAERAARNATGLAPYCSDTPSAPQVKGSGFIF